MSCAGRTAFAWVNKSAIRKGVLILLYYLLIILFSLALQPSASYGLLVHEVLVHTQRRAIVGKILSVCGQYEVQLTG
jgi:hypothetical protein